MRRGRRRALNALLIVGIVWSVRGTGIGVSDLLDGRSGASRLLSAFLRPDFSDDFLALVRIAAGETLQISVAGLLLAVLIGLPLAAVMAGNAEAPRIVRRSVGTIAAALRGVPELLWALLFVAAVGLGPAAGVYALGLHGAGLIAKLCSEQLEGVDAAPVEAVRTAGAGRIATLLLAVVPQARTGLISVILYQWECNIRSATVVGFVGAGGLGGALDISLRLFRYGELATLVLTVLALILLVDGLSRVLRRRMGAMA